MEEEGYVDSEAEESEEDKEVNDSDEEEEEEEEGATTDNLDGFINDDIDDEEVEEEEEGGDVQETKSKRRKRGSLDALEEEDLELIAENLGLEYDSRKGRRAHFESDDEEEVSKGEKGHHGDGQVAADLFGASDEELEEERTDVWEGRYDNEMSGQPREVAEEILDSEEEDDFIVDDYGKPIKRRKIHDEYSDSAIREAQDIFGLDFDPEAFEKLAAEGMESTDEELEEFVEGDEEEQDLKQMHMKAIRRKRRRKKATVQDIFEPVELERGHLTDRDKVIAMTDLPERFQLRVCPVQEGDELEWEEEADWIYNHAFCSTPVSQQSYVEQPSVDMWDEEPAKPRSCIPKIKAVLEFIKSASFEVPFIATYRREYIEPELDEEDLWKIWQWDEKWTQLRNRKTNMKKLFSRMQEFQYEKIKNNPDTVLTDEIRVLQDEDIQRLMNVETAEELNDVYKHFLLHYGADIEELQKSRRNSSTRDSSVFEGWKHAYRRDFFTICKENGLSGLAVKFGLMPDQFGENLRDRYKSHEPEQHPVEPEVAAEEYLCVDGHFSTIDAVLHGARHMVAMEIAYEPLVRQAVRQAFSKNAVLHVKLTKKGRKEIDEDHPCFTYKYLKNKPINTLKDDQFLHLTQAEEDGLLTTSLRIDKEGSYGSPYFEEIKQLFYRDEYSLLVEKWNSQRGQALSHALLRVLYPEMEKELRTKLIQEARECVLHMYLKKLRSWLSVAPFKVEPSAESWDDTPYTEKEGGPLVLACTFLPDKNAPMYCALVDGEGENVDFIKLSHFMKRENSRIEQEKEDKKRDIESLKKFLRKTRPAVVVVGANGRDTMTVVEDMKAVAGSFSLTDEMTSVNVEVMDTNVADIYSKSPRSREEFPNYPELLTAAISLGRRCIDPLLEITALYASPFGEQQSLKLHTLQNCIPSEVLATAIELELVSQLCRAGVDVTSCIERPFWSSSLQFVAGLGPRKASYILRTFRQEKIFLENRSQLVTVCKIGPKVFLNCSGFIRIDTSAFTDSASMYIEVLDSTRIHIETYEWARKMATDALEYEETVDESNPSVAVEEILESQEKAEKLGDLDLDAFAEELERQGYGNKKLTLYAIREELYGPFKDKRTIQYSLSPVEKFILLTGETPESLHEGKLITCSVVGVVRRRPTSDMIDQVNPERVNEHSWGCPFCLKSTFKNIAEVWQHIDNGSCPGQGIGVRTRLENGISGFIHIKNISDKPIKHVEERIEIGMTIHCRILKVNLEKFSVDLTSRSSDLADREKKFTIPKDTYYDYQQEEGDDAQEKIAKAKPKNAVNTRLIRHPCYHGCNSSKAETLLANGESGDAIFRPSSKGPDHLTVTWKVTDGIYQHVDIIEKDKPDMFSLGRKLIIGEEEYEDLDEILARFIQPAASNVRDVCIHKYYKATDPGDLLKLSTHLEEEKRKNPSRIPYCFSASTQFPGKFILAFQPYKKAVSEYFTPVPDGYRFRKRVFDTLEALLKWFKQHYKDRPAPDNRSMHSYQTPQSIPTPSIPSFGGTPMMISPLLQPSPSQPYTPSQPTHWGTPTPKMFNYKYNLKPS